MLKVHQIIKKERELNISAISNFRQNDSGINFNKDKRGLCCCQKPCEVNCSTDTFQKSGNFNPKTINFGAKDWGILSKLSDLVTSGGNKVEKGIDMTTFDYDSSDAERDVDAVKAAVERGANNFI